MDKERDFLQGKKNALNKLDNAKKEKKVDKKILPILEIINQSEKYYSSSSCSGRIVLIQLPEIGDKKNAEFLGKWHHIIKTEEITTSFKKAKKGQIWILAQSPIIHVISKTLKDAEKILKISISSGFKNSGLKSIGKKIVVEICSTERLDSPIGKNTEILCNIEYIELVVNIANSIIKRSDKKIIELKNQLKKKI